MKLVTETEIVKEIARNLARINGGDPDGWVGVATYWVKQMPNAFEWIPVEKGNPTEPGTYYVTMVCDEWDIEKHEPTGKLEKPYFGTREFCDYASPGAGAWTMADQPHHGLVWTEETGSGPNERVIAWMPNPGPWQEITYHPEETDAGN